MNEIINWKVLSKLRPEFVANLKFVCVFGETGDEVICVTKENNFFSFGSNRNGCLGLGHNRPVAEPLKVSQLCDNAIVDISCGYDHVLALMKSGICYSWGRNDCGQLGYKTQTNFSNAWVETCFEPQIIKKLIDESLHIIAISCGAYHSLVLTDSGRVYSFGNNIFGQLGDDSNETSFKPSEINGLIDHKVVAISCGFYHSMALTEEGFVYSWGHNSYGQLGVGNNDNSCQPIRIDFGNNVLVQKISCGFAHSLVLATDGIVYGFGYDQFGQIGCDIKLNQNIPIKVKSKTKFIEIATDFLSNISVAKSEKGLCYVWGECCLEIISIPRETRYKSIHSVFANYSKHKITYKPMFFDNKSITNDITDSISSLFNNQKYSDIQFKVENRIIFCHKLILKTRCNYFDSMLSENWSESGSKELEITQYSYSVFYAFIKYLYSDCVDIKVEEAFDLIDLSNYYCEEKLRHKCDYIIKNSINVKNACALYCAAVEHNLRDLEEYCFKFAANNLNEIRLTDSYSRMDHISRERFDKRLKLKV